MPESCGRYVHLRVPRGAVVDVRRPGPAVFHTELLRRALNHGMPAAARLPWLRTRVARSPLPVRLTAASVRRLPWSGDEELDALRGNLRDRWSDFTDQGAPGGPTPSLDQISLLGVTRSGGRTFFVFRDDDLDPCLVLTTTRSSGRRTEADAQDRAASLGVAPRQLGRMGTWLVQEGTGGLPLWIDAASDGLHWPDATMETVADLHRKLRTLALGTVRPGTPALPRVFAALSGVTLDGPTTRRVAAVERDLRRLDVQVLEHRDVSAQNLTVSSSGKVTGLVDWEFARADGIVGFDHLLAGLSLAEHGLGRYRWSGEAAYELLRAGWDDAPILTSARHAMRQTLSETTGSEDLAPQLEAAIMVSRLTASARNSVGPQTDRAALVRSLRLVLAA